MNAPLLLGLTLALVSVPPAAETHAPGLHAPAPAPGDTLSAFATEAEFLEFVRRHTPPTPRFRREAATDAPVMLEAAVSMATGASTSVTNVQHAGVDEGGIVKLHGDHLVILRRGRLFTVAVGGKALEPISMADAFGPDVDPSGTWYDELIVHDDVVAVVGYSYARGGTEVGLFSIDRRGLLRHRSTYQLRSGDYYSSRNYASRLVDGKLVFYAPVPIRSLGANPAAGMPALRRWQGAGTGGEFGRILPATRVYHVELPGERHPDLVLHTVTTCDLSRAELACDASAVAGPAGRVFYVSPGSVYVWTTDWSAARRPSAATSMLYRMPLDGSAPAALRVAGSPIDQFSFLEDGRGDLHVLVRSDGEGDGMWRSETSSGDVALLRLPRPYFSDGSRTAPASWYRALPTPAGRTFQNRFVGSHLLYGTGSGWRFPEYGGAGTLYLVPLSGGPVAALALPHGIDRIEAMGRDAVVVGTDGADLHFSSVGLGRTPSVIDRYVQKDAAQGELRSHGFFYRANGEAEGILGLPVRTSGGAGSAHLYRGSAGVIFLRTDRSHFRPLGELTSRDGGSSDDGCRASCVDWYGNARPLFLQDRVLALLGYELVEGRLEREGLREHRRISFAPHRDKGHRQPGE
jgi:hypothetical protein